MATIDHIILKVNDLSESVKFYTSVLGFVDEGSDGPFTVIRIGPSCQMQLAPWGTKGAEHYAFEVAPTEFHEIFARLKAAKIPYGPTYHSVGTDTGPGSETGARGVAPTVYFNDPNGHLLEIRSYSTPSVHS